MSQVEAAAKMIARALNGYKIIVNKSTVPVGTGELVCEIIRAERTRSDIDFDVVSNPEFLREGSAIADSLHPDRIVIGAPNSKVALRIIELYAPLERPMVHHRCGFRGNDQVCLQRVSCNEDLIYQRSGKYLHGGRR